MRSRLSLTLDEATAILGAAASHARSIGRNVSIAIADDAGSPLAFARMDGARAYTADLAGRKARASALVGVSTAMIEAAAKDRPSSPESNPGAGGLPVAHNSECVGGIGVSGAKPEEDEAIARAGLAALQPLQPS
jgi:glc operon protein GlcG